MRVFVDRVPEYAITDGVVCCDVGEIAIHIPLRIFRMGMARADKALAEYDARLAKVVPIKRARH